MNQSEQENNCLVLDNLAVTSEFHPEQIAQEESYFIINAEKFSTINAKGVLYNPKNLEEVRCGAMEAGTRFSKAFGKN